MSSIKLNTDCICHGHLASNALSYMQENNTPLATRLAANQSARTIVAV